jgi:hypothetical protein
MKNLPNYGWHHEQSKSVTTCHPEDRDSMFIQNVSQLHGITGQEAVIFTETICICKLKILQFLFSLSIAVL